MNKYIVKFDKVTKNENEIELNPEVIINIFDEIVNEKCIIEYKDNMEYGFSLLFKDLEENKENYLKESIKIEQELNSQLTDFNNRENTKKLSDLI